MQAMGRFDKLRRLLGNLPAWPAGRRVLARDRAGALGEDHGVATHLQACAEWLARAQDAVATVGGVSAAWHFRLGWLPPFPETTGYIIPSLLDCAELLGDHDYRRRAEELGAWELAIQKDDGSVRTDIGLNEAATVFDTGQGLFGFVALAAGGDEAMAAAAERAGDWLISRQDDDGCWRRDTFRAVPHAYNTRTAWALALLGRLNGEDRFAEAASRNLAWARGQQQSDAWIEDMAFHPDEKALTHTIAYTLRGLLEGGLLLEDGAAVAAARSGAAVLRDQVDGEGWLPGAFGRGWTPDRGFSCLTGNAQLAIVFHILASLDPDSGWGEAASKLTRRLRREQDLAAGHPGLRGGVKGSSPVNGHYSPWAMLNWAVKFLLDALMLELAARRDEGPRWARGG